MKQVISDFRQQVWLRKETITPVFCLEVFSRPQFTEGEPKQRTASRQTEAAEIGIEGGWSGWNLKGRAPWTQELYQERAPDIYLRVLLEAVDHKGLGGC